MAEITAKLVSELREKTGAQMMECKKALQETGGDIEKAIDLLRKKGAASAEKKGSRVAADGLVGMAIEGVTGALVEVNAETDFVARNAQFQEMVQKIAFLAIEAKGDIEKTKSMAFGDGGSVADHITKLIATIGENMTFRRSATLSVKSGVVAGYMHSAAGANIGKIGVLVALESNGDRVKLESVGKQIAMHIAAANPQALTSDKLDKALIEREKAIYVEQAMQSGKPKEIAEKMVEGRLRKFFEEVCLLDQVFIIDNETKISKVLENAGKEASAPVTISGYLRFALGEGVQKKETDFAAEVAAMVKTA